MKKINVLNNYTELSKRVADIFEHYVSTGISPHNHMPRIVLPTGSTPIGMYKELVKRDLDWSFVITYNLDEYVIDYDHEQSYYSYMKGHFFDHINLTNYHFPPEFSDIWRPFHETYGVDADLCILGIGSNGHIAFNEPGTPFDSITRIVELDEQTIKDNARFFLSIYEVPTEAITMGLKTIMSAKKIVLMAAGKHKKDILDKAMNGKVTEKVPASILQTHDNVEVYYCD